MHHSVTPEQLQRWNFTSKFCLPFAPFSFHFGLFIYLFIYILYFILLLFPHTAHSFDPVVSSALHSSSDASDNAHYRKVKFQIGQFQQVRKIEILQMFVKFERCVKFKHTYTHTFTHHTLSFVFSAVKLKNYHYFYCYHYHHHHHHHHHHRHHHYYHCQQQHDYSLNIGRFRPQHALYSHCITRSAFLEIHYFFLIFVCFSFASRHAERAKGLSAIGCAYWAALWISWMYISFTMHPT